MSSKQQYKEYTKSLRYKIKELEIKLEISNNEKIKLLNRTARDHIRLDSYKRQLEVKKLPWYKLIFIRNKEVKMFLYDLYKRLVVSNASSSFGDILYVMWEEDKCIKDKIEELLKLK